MSGCEVENVQEQIPYEAEKHIFRHYRHADLLIQSKTQKQTLRKQQGVTLNYFCFALLSFGVTINAKRGPIIQLQTYKYRKNGCMKALYNEW